MVVSFGGQPETITGGKSKDSSQIMVRKCCRITCKYTQAMRAQNVVNKWLGSKCLKMQTEFKFLVSALKPKSTEFNFMQCSSNTQRFGNQYMKLMYWYYSNINDERRWTNLTEPKPASSESLSGSGWLKIWEYTSEYWQVCLYLKLQTSFCN